MLLYADSVGDADRSSSRLDCACLALQTHLLLITLSIRLLLDVQTRQSFSELLASSLKVETRMRAWYNAALGYQPVQQTRLPKTLPKVGKQLLWQPASLAAPIECDAVTGGSSL